MRIKSSFVFFPAVLSVLSSTLYGAVQYWDPDGATAGTSISGNWDTTTPNWTVTPDSGVNTTWTQGSDSFFNIAANYTVTVTQPITIGNITVSGSAGTLTIAGTPANSLSLAGSSLFDTGGRNVTLSAPITGAFDLTRTGAGTVTLSGASTYSGGTTLNAGTSALAVDSASSGGLVTSGPFGTGPVNISIVAPSTTVTLSASGSRVLDNTIVLNTNLTIAGSAALNFRNGGWQLIGGGRTVTVNNSADTTLQNLSDDGTARTLTKAGSGRLVMMAGGPSATFLGGITASAGRIVVGSDTPFPTNNNNQITLNSSTLDLNGFDLQISRLGGNSSGSVLLGSRTLTAGGGASAEFSGVISGTGAYVKVGAVSQVLSGSNTFSGGITITEGALYLPTNGVSGSSISLGAGTNTITITGNGRIGANRSTGTSIITNSIILANAGPTAGLDPANGNTFILAGPVSGSGGFLRYSQGSGIAALTGSNTFTGGVEIDARTLAIGHKNALGSGPFTIGNPINPPSSTIVVGTMADLSGANAITNVTTVNQTFTISATNTVELSGPMTLSAQVGLTTLGNRPITVSGAISGPGGFTKYGTNNLELTSANGYGDTTTVNQGTLLANNAAGSATGTNYVIVNQDALLAGTGTIAGPVLVNAGGSVSGGNNIGKLTLQDGADFSGGGTNVWELAAQKDDTNGVPGSDFDQIAITGGNLVLGGSSVLSIRFTGPAASPTIGNPFWQVNHTWEVVNLSGGAVNVGNATFAGLDGTNDISAGTFSTSVDAGGSIILSYTAGPVPPAPVINGNISGAGTTNAVITWSAVSGVTYQVQYKDNLTDSSWSLLGSVAASSSTASISDTTNPPAPHRFYRVVVQ